MWSIKASGASLALLCCVFGVGTALAAKPHVSLVATGGTIAGAQASSADLRLHVRRPSTSTT